MADETRARPGARLAGQSETRVRRPLLIVAAVAVALAAFVGAHVQTSLWPDVDHPPPFPRSLLWPREENAWLRLPVLDADPETTLDLVESIEDAPARLWVGGQLATRGDDGTWTLTDLPDDLDDYEGHFATARDGVVYDGTRAYVTRDGGANWRELPGQLRAVGLLAAGPTAVLLYDKTGTLPYFFDLDSWTQSPALPRTAGAQKLYLSFTEVPRGAEAQVTGIGVSFRIDAGLQLACARLSACSDVKRDWLRPIWVKRRGGYFRSARDTLYQSDRPSLDLSAWRRALTLRQPGQAGLRHAVHVAPWYWLSWLPVIALALVGLRQRKLPPLPQAGIAQELVSDQPIREPAEDVLGADPIARAISGFIRNEATRPPLTLAVTGEWGTGKSSLLNLIRGHLDEAGALPVWFNAWHHENDDDILASLFHAIIERGVPRGLEALPFRLRLLWARSKTSLFAVLATCALLAFAAGFFAKPQRREAAAQWLKQHVGPAQTSKPAAQAEKPAPHDGAQEVLDVLDEVPPGGALLSTLVGLLSLSVLSWRGLRSFGVDPARMVAQVGKSMSVSAVEARLGFRARFAGELQQFTRAVAPRRMVILIDDLDRCAEEQVMKVVEAVNYLVTCGELFVILAVSRSVIEQHVGRAFRKLADALPAPDEAPSDLPPQALRKRRIEYARRYLEKLFNVEVSVPSAAERQKELLGVAGGLERRAPARAPRPREVVRGWLTAAAAGAALSVGLAALITLGYAAANARLPIDAAPVADSWPPAQASLLPARPSVEHAPRPDPRSGEEQPSARISVAAAAGGAPWRDRSLGASAFGSAALIALALLAWQLKREHETAVHDSDAFRTELRDHADAIGRANPTPRVLKRFLNRLRFNATLLAERGFGGPEVDRALVRLAAGSGDARHAAGDLSELERGLAEQVGRAEREVAVRA